MRVPKSRATCLGAELFRALAAAVAVLVCCAPASAADTSRIVTIGGDVTEIVVALGIGDRIIAVDTTSQYPREAIANKKSVGYMRALSSEGVLSTSPSLVLANEHAGPPEVVAALKASTVPFISVPSEDTAEGVAHKAEFIAKALGVAGEGETLAKRIRADFAALTAERAKITKPARAIFLLSIQGARAVVGGKTTSADAILSLAGVENAVKDLEGYKPLSDEAALQLAPDAIVVMRRTDSGTHGAPTAAKSIGEEIAGMSGLGATPAGKAGRILEFDGSYLLQFGPRAAQAARELMHTIYPGLSKPAGSN